MSGSENVLMRLARRRMERDNKKDDVGSSSAKALQNKQFINKLLSEADFKFTAAHGGDVDNLRKERHAILRQFLIDLEKDTINTVRHAVQADIIPPLEALRLQRSIRSTCKELRAMATGEPNSYRPERLTVLLGAIDALWKPSNVIAIA